MLQLTAWEMSPLAVAGAFGLMAMLPLALLGMTAFLKLSVVLAFLRTALGAGQIPSASVSSLLALVLTVYIMAPVGAETWQRVTAGGLAGSPLDTDRYAEVLAPWQEFLEAHSGAREQALFRKLYKERLHHASQANDESVFSEEIRLGWLVPAFVLTELREAFLIGFCIYLPFLAVDLIVASLLVGLGMVMVSPAMISLPLKVLLFVGAEGWLLLSESLLRGYTLAGN